MTDYTYNTGNPIGSTDVRDGVDNLKSLDVLLNSTDDTYQDRLGNTVPTAAGAIKRLGPVVTAWTFTTGGTLNYPNEAALNPADGNFYGWTGVFPHVVAPGTDPTLPGSGYVQRSDVLLRSELSTAGGEMLIASVGSISELLSIPAVDGARVSVKSYNSGWATLSSPPVGGGVFIFVDGGTLDDGVVNFASSGGSWRRSVPSATIDAAMSGMSPSNSAADNDAAFARLRSYCVANMAGFTINGMHNVNAQVDTDGITFITGGDGALGATGFSWSGKAPGDVCFLWGRKTRLSDLTFFGQNSISGASNGVTGISGHPAPKGMYTNRAERIFVHGFGTGIHMHDAVGSEIDGYRISNCHKALVLDGFSSNAEYSTTLGFKNGYIIGNVDGVVGGSNGVGWAAAVSVNFHNTIFEKNSGCGFICDSGAYNGTTYNSLDIRELVFSGYTWFELNTYAYVFRKVRSLYITGPFRLEANSTQLTVPTEFSDDTVSVAESGWLAGTLGRRGQITSSGVVIRRDGTLGAGVVIGGLFARDEAGVVASSVEITQQTDGAAEGRTTAVAIKTKSATDANAVTRLLINRFGHTTPGSDNIQTLGSASLRWSTVYAGTGAINTSDERAKTFIDITETELAVATELKGMIRKFKFNDAILEKGEGSARMHFGVGAQSVADVFVKHGLDPNQYALFCHDEWNEQPEIVDDFGNVTQQYRAAGDRFGIRYDELICFILCSI